MSEERKDELRKALGVEETLKEKIREETEKEMGPARKGRWHFSFGKHRWGFWVLVAAFILFLLTQFVIRPLVAGG